MILNPDEQPKGQFLYRAAASVKPGDRLKKTKGPSEVSSKYILLLLIQYFDLVL